MKGKDIFNAFTKIDEEYIEESERFCSDEKMIYEAMKGRTHRRAAAIALAAVLCVAVFAVLVIKPKITDEKTPTDNIGNNVIISEKNGDNDNDNDKIKPTQEPEETREPEDTKEPEETKKPVVTKEPVIDKNDNSLMSYEDILNLEYGSNGYADGEPFEGSDSPHSAVMYKVLKARYYIIKDNSINGGFTGFRTYDVKITKVNKKINGLNLKVGDRKQIFFNGLTNIAFNSTEDYYDAVNNAKNIVNLDGKEFCEFYLYKRYRLRINTMDALNMEGNIFLKEGEEYAAYLYNGKNGLRSYATYPLNDAEHVMSAQEIIYKRGDVKVRIGKRMINIVNGKEKDITPGDEFNDLLDYRGVWGLHMENSDNKENIAKISDNRYDMLDRLKTEDGKNKYALAVVHAMCARYYINKENKIICIYEIDPGWVADKYNTIGLKTNDVILWDDTIKATAPSTYLRLKDESKLQEVIDRSIGTLTIGTETYYEIYLEKQYKYELIKDPDGAIVLGRGNYAIELNTCDPELNEKGIYQIEYAFPNNTDSKQEWEQWWADHRGTGNRWDGGKVIEELIFGENGSEVLKR